MVMFLLIAVLYMMRVDDTTVLSNAIAYSEIKDAFTRI